MLVIRDNYEALGLMIRSLVCLEFVSLPIPPEYLPDPPKLWRDRMRANDLSRPRSSSPFGHARYGDLKENSRRPDDVR